MKIGQRPNRYCKPTKHKCHTTVGLCVAGRRRSIILASDTACPQQHNLDTHEDGVATSAEAAGGVGAGMREEQDLAGPERDQRDLDGELAPEHPQAGGRRVHHQEAGGGAQPRARAREERGQGEGAPHGLW